jgi:hypothetical protein
VEHAEARVRERAVARQRAADRRRRRRSGAVWALRVLLPLLGAAAVLAAFEQAGGDLGDWSPAAAVAIPVALLLVPAVISAALARPEGIPMALLWLLVTLAAEVALVFCVGFVALGLGPG